MQWADRIHDEVREVMDAGQFQLGPQRAAATHDFRPVIVGNTPSAHLGDRQAIAEGVVRTLQERMQGRAQRFVAPVALPRWCAPSRLTGQISLAH